MFKDFGRRLQRDMKMIVNERIETSERLSGVKSSGVDVQVISHKRRRNAICLEDPYWHKLLNLRATTRNKTTIEYGPLETFPCFPCHREYDEFD